NDRHAVGRHRRRHHRRRRLATVQMAGNLFILDEGDVAVAGIIHALGRRDGDLRIADHLAMYQFRQLPEADFHGSVLSSLSGVVCRAEYIAARWKEQSEMNELRTEVGMLPPRSRQRGVPPTMWRNLQFNIALRKISTYDTENRGSAKRCGTPQGDVGLEGWKKWIDWEMVFASVKRLPTNDPIRFRPSSPSRVS